MKSFANSLEASEQKQNEIREFVLVMSENGSSFNCIAVGVWMCM